MVGVLTLTQMILIVTLLNNNSGVNLKLMMSMILTVKKEKTVVQECSKQTINFQLLGSSLMKSMIIMAILEYQLIWKEKVTASKMVNLDGLITFCR